MQVVLLFALGVSVLAGAFFGLAPALQAARVDASHVLRQESRAARKDREARRGRSALWWSPSLRSLGTRSHRLTAMTLLIAAGLLSRSFWISTCASASIPRMLRRGRTHASAALLVVSAAGTPGNVSGLLSKELGMNRTGPMLLRRSPGRQVTACELWRRPLHPPDLREPLLRCPRGIVISPADQPKISSHGRSLGDKRYSPSQARIRAATTASPHTRQPLKPRAPRPKTPYCWTVITPNRPLA